ncbi:GNAT family N-acetyltransferase [Niallia sp. NCCP-28]|uniref:GNAT family N-acetyltransferase n=1 Tax=Niallia sp. NCCP-28 TaxID=2934712 RepID=UPI0020892F6B|nr:GNAT family N-acetyltransferase [Niallia sp. NCCP-28]GKU80816.1 N-acetyltransferase [Niallia sp. NCCP-28]
MIRDMQEKDLPEVLEIYNDAIIHTTAVYSYTPQTLQDRKIWYKQKVEDGYPVLVFEENNIVMGFATYGQFRPWPGFKYTIEHSVYVHKEFRKKGIGTKLLKALIAVAESQKYATLIAGIDANNEKSILAHKKLGFYHAGTIKRAGYKFEKWLDLSFYQLDLQGPDHPTEN